MNIICVFVLPRFWFSFLKYISFSQEPTRALLAAIDVLNAATPRLLELYGEEATAADEELAATCLSLHAQCAALIESFEGAALTAALLAGGAGGWEVETVESGGRR